MGRMSKNVIAYLVNWDALENAITSAGFNSSQISQILGRAPNWLGSNKYRNLKISEKDLNTIAFITKARVEDFINVEPVATNDTETIDKPHISDSELITMVKELDNKMNKIIELLAGLSMDKPKPVEGFDNKPKTRHERATGILRALLDNSQGRCRKTEYIKQLMVQDIGSSYADSAIKEVGAEVAVVGYGNNKTIWIMKGEE